MMRMLIKEEEEEKIFCMMMVFDQIVQGQFELMMVWNCTPSKDDVITMGPIV